jgi:hypothetical protein
MHTLSSSSCKVLDGCLTTTVHKYLAWGFVILLVATVAAVVWRTGLRVPVKDQNSEYEQPAVYTRTQPLAENVKAILQMIIGIVAVSVVGWRLIYAPGGDPTKLILQGIGVGLAAAAALELAYTLFTPGPDEALDPLMLALSATVLLKLAQLGNTVSLASAGALLILGVLLAVLFATRLLLAERAEGEHPNIWWVPRSRGRNNGPR